VQNDTAKIFAEMRFDLRPAKIKALLRAELLEQIYQLFKIVNFP